MHRFCMAVGCRNDWEKCDYPLELFKLPLVALGIVSLDIFDFFHSLTKEVSESV